MFGYGVLAGQPLFRSRIEVLGNVMIVRPYASWGKRNELILIPPVSKSDSWSGGIISAVLWWLEQHAAVASISKSTAATVLQVGWHNEGSCN